MSYVRPGGREHGDIIPDKEVDTGDISCLQMYSRIYILFMFCPDA